MFNQELEGPNSLRVEIFLSKNMLGWLGLQETNNVF